jgi:hypothetical protein
VAGAVAEAAVVAGEGEGLEEAPESFFEHEGRIARNPKANL